MPTYCSAAIRPGSGPQSTSQEEIPQCSSTFRKMSLRRPNRISSKPCSFTETAADATEKLFELNVKTAKAASADVVSQIKALTSVKDVQELDLPADLVRAGQRREGCRLCPRGIWLGHRDAGRSEQAGRDPDRRDQQERRRRRSTRPPSRPRPVPSSRSRPSSPR